MAIEYLEQNNAQEELRRMLVQQETNTISNVLTTIPLDNFVS